MKAFAVWSLVLASSVAATTATAAQSADGRGHPTTTTVSIGSGSMSLLERRARLHLTDVPIRVALDELQKRSSVPIAYSRSLLPSDLLVNCDCYDTTVGEALWWILHDTPFRYTEVGNQVIVERAVWPGSHSGHADESGVVSGIVVDAATGEPLDGVHVFIAETGRGVLTDARGRYLLLDIPPSRLTLQAALIGYATEERRVDVAADRMVTTSFDLEAKALRLPEVAITVGTRAAHSAADELGVPVDVYEAKSVRATSRIGLSKILQELSPSINFNQQANSDLTSSVPTLQMRGLSPDHALVLVNGKRRHPTAVVHVFGGAALGAGSSGVDLNAIPPQAIRKIEILRDGAASQYGSDAIAGVINIGLKNAVSPFTMRGTYGLHTPQSYWGGVDGQRWELSGNVGLPLFQKGTLNLTAQITDQNATSRGCPDSRDQIVPGDADVIDWERCSVVEKRNPVTQPTYLYGNREARNYMVFANSLYPLIGGKNPVLVYGFGGLSTRTNLSTGHFRRSIQNVNWPEIYPHGFLPGIDADTRDLMAVIGVRGESLSWNYDLSAQVGQNRVDTHVVNSLNTSLGPCLDIPCAPGKDGIMGTSDDPGVPNQTEFDTGTLELSQYVADFSATRTFELGLPKPANLAWGAVYRAERYRILEGERASWINGYHSDQEGGVGAAGSQVFFGYSPKQAVDEWRTNLGFFADFEATPAETILLALAARWENYTDFGSTLTGKVSVRYQPLEQVVLRAAASSGFRAPALAQQHYAHVSTAFREIDGVRIPIEIGEFPVSSPEARALGAKPLREETSHNLSAGVAVSPAPGLTLTADAYLIRVYDRIMLTNLLNVRQSTPDGRRIIEELLAPYAVMGVKYFMNAFNSETRGLDLTARYEHRFAVDRLMRLTASYNLTRQELLGDLETPDVLAGMGAVLYPKDWRVATTQGRPQDRIIGQASYRHGHLEAQLAANYYGEITELLSEDPYVLQVRAGKATFDVGMSYDLSRETTLTLGAENIFNAFTDRNYEGYDSGGRNPYSSAAVGRNGRFVYSRLTVRL